MLNEKHDYEEPYDSDDEKGIVIVFDLLSKFLEKNAMTFVFDNNFYWNEPYIGVKIKDYNLFSESDKKKVSDFCDKYNLPKPTFYAGIMGELK